MNEEQIFGALIGLAGAAAQNGKTADTDAILCRALTQAPSQALLDAIASEKARIAPNCATCANPCGNTSDYDMTRLTLAPQPIRQLKWAVMAQLKALARKANGAELPECAYKALCYLGYDLTADSYQTLLEEMRQ
jgi:hydroxylamine reductase